jgi:hypothetical protein
MAKLTIDQRLEKLAQQMNIEGKELMSHKSETYKMRGTELRVAGAMILEWANEIKGEADELEASSPEADETVSAEAEDSVDKSEEV